MVLSTAGMRLVAKHAASFVAINLGTIHGVGSSDAFAVNDKGLVVGSSAISDSNSSVLHAFVWSADTGMTDLGTLGNDTQSTAIAVDNNGVIAGFDTVPQVSPLPPLFHAFVRTRSIGLAPLSLGGSNSSSTASNAKGDIVGYSDSASNPSLHAFLWTARDGVTRDLGTLGGDTSFAYAINDDDVVVGESAIKSGEHHAFMWTPRAGMMIDLGTLGGFTSAAQAVSDKGVIVGNSQVDSGANHAFIWTRQTGRMVDIGSGGDAVGTDGVAFNSFGEKINGGFVIGHFTPNNTMHGFVWTEKRGFVDIGTLPHDVGSLVVGVNDRGVVAGNSFSGSASHAFVWSSGRIVPLETPAGFSSHANAMNGDFIVGASCDGQNVCHATLWKPAPHSRKDQDRDDDDQD